MQPSLPASSRLRQSGLSLIEMMIAMVIGLGVVGAGFAMFVSSGYASKGSSAITQMTEDASLTLNLLRNHIAMAGYSSPTGVDGNGLVKRYTGAAVFGCDGKRIDVDATTGEASCGTEAVDGGSLAVMYEADASNTIPTTTAPVRPTDCLGNGLADLAPGEPKPFYLAVNRFHVQNNTLFCDGNGAGTAHQPLVDNVESIFVRYGVAGTTTDASGATVPMKVAQTYLSPAEMTADHWSRVVSVRLCVVIQSREPILDAPTAYWGCDGTSQPPAANDRRLYKAFSTTIVLHNRIL